MALVAACAWSVHSPKSARVRSWSLPSKWERGKTNNTQATCGAVALTCPHGCCRAMSVEFVTEEDPPSDIFSDVIKIIKQAKSLHDAVIQQGHDKSSSTELLDFVLDHTKAIHESLQIYLRSLLMAPLNRRMLIPRPGSKLSTEEKARRVQQDVQQCTDDVCEHTQRNSASLRERAKRLGTLTL